MELTEESRKKGKEFVRKCAAALFKNVKPALKEDPEAESIFINDIIGYYLEFLAKGYTVADSQKAAFEKKSKSFFYSEADVREAQKLASREMVNN